MNPTSYLIDNICRSCIEMENFPKNVSKLVHVHTQKLSKHGDMSFPCNVEIWRNALAAGGCGHAGDSGIFEKLRALDEDSDGRTANGLVEQSSQWTFPVQRLNVKNQRCSIYLRRSSAISYFMKTLLNPSDAEGVPPSFGYMPKNPNRRVYLPPVVQHEKADANVTIYRSNIVRETLIRVIKHSDWILERDAPPSAEERARDATIKRIQVASLAAGVQREYEESENVREIRCGLVMDPGTGKMAKMDTKEYLALRTHDMFLLARHKYGIRTPADEKFNALMRRLGEAAVCVDFLEVKHSSPVKLILNGHGSTKGGSFFLYNSARIEALLRKFDEDVLKGVYKPLPKIEDIDMSLLKEEEEWTLIFTYVMGFPQLIEAVLENLERGQCATHLIIRYLSGFVAVFSVYYSRVRILLHSRDHLSSLVHARIYLVKAIRKILNMALELLNIDPVQFM